MTLIKTISCIQKNYILKISRHIVAILSLWLVLISPLCVRDSFIMEKQLDLFSPVDNQTAESWKDVPGWEGYYQASTFGNIKSLDRVIICKLGRHFNFIGQQIKPQVNKLGYYQLRFTKNSKGNTLLIHQIIAWTFLDNPNKYPVVNHKNGIKSDNCFSNLEWCTHSHNIQHAFTTGLNSAKGIKNSHATLTDEIVLNMREDYKNGLTRMELVKKYNTKYKNTFEIIKGTTWKHLL